MEKVISVKKKSTNNTGIFGELERQECEVIVVQGNVKTNVDCFMDIDEIQKYLNKYEFYLNEKKKNLINNALKGTFKKRLKYNLIASPLYIFSLFATFLPFAGNPVMNALIQAFGLVIGASTVTLFNLRTLYVTPETESKINDLQKIISECSNLQTEALERISNKKNDDLERARIEHQALKRKRALINQARSDELERFRTRVTSKINSSDLMNSNTVDRQDIPDYLKRR